MNKNNLDQSELNREMILDLFYSTNGNLDEINQTIDEKLKIRGFRKITLFEEFVKNRLVVNPHILQMPKMEVSTIECIYLCQYTAINKKAILSDVRYDLVKKYREHLADGSYQIKSDELADKIVQKVKENKNITFL